MAVSGHNGNNESKIGVSNSIGLSVYDEQLNEIKISNLKSPIDLVIPRDIRLPQYSYQYVNATNIDLPPNAFLLFNGINLAAVNSSLHIELKPTNLTLGYLLVIKLGSTPIVNSTFADFSSFKLFCPSNFL